MVRGNDFTQVRFTDNVAWRGSYPARDQRWPAGFEPRIRDSKGQEAEDGQR